MSTEKADTEAMCRALGLVLMAWRDGGAPWYQVTRRATSRTPGTGRFVARSLAECKAYLRGLADGRYDSIGVRAPEGEERGHEHQHQH